jgi:hypothetical protein
MKEEEVLMFQEESEVIQALKDLVVLQQKEVKMVRLVK